MKISERYRRLSLWNKIATIASILTILGFFLAFYFYFFPYQSNKNTITHTEIKNNNLIVYSSNGISWTHNFSGTVVKSEIVKLFKNNKKSQVLVSIGEGDDKNITDCGSLYCFNNKGKLIWKHKCPTFFNYNGASSGKIKIMDFIVGNFENDENYILLSCRDANGWYQSYLSLLNNKGEQISKYWHPGFINNIALIKNKSGNKSIIFSACNNDLSPLIKGDGRIYVVGMLNYPFEGEAPPYFGKSVKGNELWYLGILPKDNSILRFLISDFNKDNQEDISIWTQSGHNAHINTLGELIGLSSTDQKEKGEFDIVKIK